VRIWGYSTHYIYDPIYMPFDKSKDIPYIHKPNLLKAKARGLSIINSNSLGLRSTISGLAYGEKYKNEYRITITGDSVTFGEGIEYTEDTYCEVLQKFLNNRQNILNIKVLNYGVSAYSVREMEATLKYRMLEIKQDLVIMAIVPGDFDLTRTGEVDKWGYTFNIKLSGFVDNNSRLKQILRKFHLVYLLRDRKWPGCQDQI